MFSMEDDKENEMAVLDPLTELHLVSFANDYQMILMQSQSCKNVTVLCFN
jgi:hypothetical protein